MFNASHNTCYNGHMNRMTKKCVTCEKPVGRNNKSGLCDVHLKSKYYFNNVEKTAAYAKQYRKDNADRCRENRKKYQNKDPESFKKNRIKQAKSLSGKYDFGKKSARYRNKEWSLTRDEYKFVMLNSLCAYCESSLDGYGVGLDRIDNLKGYSLDNVVPCCGSCNAMKGTHLSYNEMKIGMKAIMEFRKTKIS